MIYIKGLNAFIEIDITAVIVVNSFRLAGKKLLLFQSFRQVIPKSILFWGADLCIAGLGQHNARKG